MVSPSLIRLPSIDGQRLIQDDEGPFFGQTGEVGFLTRQSTVAIDPVLGGGGLTKRSLMEPTALASGDPSQLGDWRVLSKLGDGGMGSVYLGEAAGRLAALKTLHPQVARGATASERFRREYAAAQLVDSPFVAAVVDAGLSDAHPYIAIEYIDGLTLEDHIARGGPLTGGDLRDFGHDLAAGIAAIHEVGVTHRDLKPSNVIMTNDGPVIIDFGIALTDEIVDLTATNQIVGSPGWISPEQLEAEPVGPQSDVFGWGALMQFAATGENPYGTGSAQALMYRIASGRPNPHAIPAPVGDLVTRALQRQPATRPTVARLLRATASLADPEQPDRDQLDPDQAQANPVEVLASGTRDRNLPVTVAVGVALVIAFAAATFGAQVLLSRDGGGDASDSSQVESDRAVVPASQESVGPALQESGVTLVPDCEAGETKSLRDIDLSGLGAGDRLELTQGCTFSGPLVLGEQLSGLSVVAGPGTDRPRPIVTNAAGTDGDGVALITLFGSDITVSGIDFDVAAPSRDELCNNNPKGWVVGIRIAPNSTRNLIESISVSGAHAGVFIDEGATANTVTNSTFDSNIMMNDTSGANGVLVFGDENVIEANTFTGHTACHPEWLRGAGAAVGIYGGSRNLVTGNSSVEDRTFLSMNAPEDRRPTGNVIERNVVSSSDPQSAFASVRIVATTVAAELGDEPNRIVHNTVVLDGGDSIGMFCEDCSRETLVLANNILWAARPVEISPRTGSYLGGSNLVWHVSGRIDSSQLDAITGAADIEADPMFAGAAWPQPQDCSPAVDGASSDPVLADPVLAAGADTTMVIGLALDIGAVEYDGARCDQ